MFLGLDLGTSAVKAVLLDESCPLSAVATQPRRRLRQYREQGGFGMRKARGGFAQIRPGRGFHAFDGAAERGVIQI